MDKIDRLLDAMEHPEKYSPTELDAMFQDPEANEVLDLLDKTKSSLQSINLPNIDDEWKKFDEKQSLSANPNRHWFAGLFSRNAAASIVIAIASFTAVAAIVGVGIHHINNTRAVLTPETEVVAESKTITAIEDTIKSVESDKEKPVEIVVFEDEPLETILNGIAGYYEYKVAFNNEASKYLRLYFKWNQTLTIEEVVERLNNFEQLKLTIKDRTIKVD